MRYVFFLCLLAACAAATAQNEGAAAPPGEDSRKALIKSALGGDSGEVTALEGSTLDGGGVFVGYSSGTLLNCRGERGCREFGGTPHGQVNTPVTAIAVSRQGGAEIIWVSYPHGVLYRCDNLRCDRHDR